jgi:hypothetical protein
MRTDFPFKMLGILVLGLLATTTEAQTRTWGFSKDAVYEWAADMDSVVLANQGTDTLKFDTAWLEVVGTAPHGCVVRFRPSPGAGQYYALSTSSTYWGPSPKSIVIAPSQSGLFREFWIDVDAPPLAKSAVGAAVGDTLRARLIFQASAGRGRDTLLVNGTQQTTSLRFMRRPQYGGHTALDRSFDPLGRRVDPASASVRVPLRPVIAPKE